MKKIISIFVAIAMLTAVFSVMIPTAVSAADIGYDETLQEASVFSLGDMDVQNSNNLVTLSSNTTNQSQVMLLNNSGGKQGEIGGDTTAISSAGLLGVASQPVMQLNSAGNLKVEFFNSNTASSSNSINPQFKITNSGSSNVNLSDLKLRYYYTVDGSAEQTFWCDHAAILSGEGGYEQVSSVKGTFVKMGSASNNADTYLEISFSSGTLTAGSRLELQGRFAKNDWSNYDQSNDYSFMSSGSQFASWDKVTAYVGGSLVSGVEPGGSAPPRPTTGPTPRPTSTQPPANAVLVDIGTGR